MSEAKRCDRCGNFYNFYDINEDTLPERGMIKLKNVYFIGAYGRNSTRCGYFDLCPECSKSFVNWFDRGIEKQDDPICKLPEEIDKEPSCKHCYYSKQSSDQIPCNVCNNYSRFVEGGKIEDVVF